MNAKTHRTSVLSLLALAAGGLLAVACSQEQGGGKAPPAQATETAQSTQSEATPSSGSKTGLAEVEVGGAGWAPAQLDTGIDLSNLSTPVEPKPKIIETEAVGAPPPPTISVPGAPAGKLVIEDEARSHDFGEVLQGAAPAHVFHMTNEGEGDIVLQSIKPSCGCTLAEVVVEPPGGEAWEYEVGQPIPPGSKIQVGAKLNTENLEGSRVTNITLTSNDPAGPIRLGLSAFVKPVIVVEPLRLNLGQLSTVDKREETVAIYSPRDEFFKASAELNTETENLEYELVPLDPNAEGLATKWELRLNAGPGIPEGIFRRSFTIKSELPGDEKPRESRVFVMASVRGMVVADPPYVSFGIVRPGQSVNKTFVIENRDPEFELGVPTITVEGATETFSAEKNLTIETRPLEEGNKFEVSVTVHDLPEDFVGSFGGRLVASVNYPSKPEVRVRFNGVARPGVDGSITPGIPGVKLQEVDHSGHDHGPGEHGTGGGDTTGHEGHDHGPGEHGTGAGDTTGHEGHDHSGGDHAGHDH